MSYEHLCRCGIPVRNCLDTIACEARILRARAAELERERDALRARAETAERQRDGLAQTISISARETATLALRVAELEREVQGVSADCHDATCMACPKCCDRLERELEGMRQRARAAEAQRDEAVSRAQESLTESVRAKAAAARLREALGRWARVVGDFRAGVGSSRDADSADGELLAFVKSLASAPSAEPEGPDYSGLCSAPECGGHCGFAHAVGCEAIREYLAEHGGAPYKAPARTAHLAPSAEPTPRDMRVAEAVYFDALSDFLPEGLRARDREHLAAVVAKAVGT